MLKINLAKDALDFLRKIPSKHAKQVLKKIDSIAASPPSHDSIILSGFKLDIYRAKSGEYRIAYHWDEKNLYIQLIGKRNDDEVYKRLKRLMH